MDCHVSIIVVSKLCYRRTDLCIEHHRTVGADELPFLLWMSFARVLGKIVDSKVRLYVGNGHGLGHAHGRSRCQLYGFLITS